MPGTRSSAGPQRWLRGRRREPSDAALAACAGQGDGAAFEQIFRRHHARLLACCRHTLLDASDAEDALQQTFIAAHGSLRTSGPPRELRPWQYAIARNCCRDIRARRPRHLHLPAELPLAGLGDPVREREELRQLLRDVAALPEQQRTALLLAELEGMPHRSIAAIVGCPEAKVRALVYQARSTLLAERGARETPCETIRQELAVARSGQLRRGPLRRHLRGCPSCREFAEGIRAQRSALALALPVAPAADLLPHVLAHAGGSGAAGAVAAAVAGASGAAGSAAGSSSMLGIGGAVKGITALAVAAAAAVGVSSLPGSTPPPDSVSGGSAPASVSILPASITGTNASALAGPVAGATHAPQPASSPSPASTTGTMRASTASPRIRLRQRILAAALVRHRIRTRVVRRARRRAAAPIVLARARTRVAGATAPTARQVGAGRLIRRRRILRALR